MNPSPPFHLPSILPDARSWVTWTKRKSRDTSPTSKAFPLNVLFWVRPSFCLFLSAYNIWNGSLDDQFLHREKCGDQKGFRCNWNLHICFLQWQWHCLYIHIYIIHIYIYIILYIYMYRILRFLGLTFWHPVAKWPLVTCAAKRERLLAERESEKTEFISDRHS